MKTFAVISGKGGSGKTIFTASFAIALEKYIRFVEEPDPRVLLVDLDLHVRGLSLLLHSDLAILRQVKITSYTILENDKYDIKNLSDDLNTKELSISNNISVLPSTNLVEVVNWTKIHSWSTLEIIKKIKILIEAAKKAGFNIVILDTRAGPDNISLAAALSTDLTFILLERDKVSWLNSIGLIGEIEHLRKEITSEIKEPSISRIVFVHNKTVDSYSSETKDVLKDLTFLPAIPMSINFLRQYNSNSNLLMINGEIFNTELGPYLLETFQDALKEINIPFTIHYKTGIRRLYKLFKFIIKIFKK